MMPQQTLLGIHDWSPEWAAWLRDAGVRGWCVTTHALNAEAGYDFRARPEGSRAYGITPIARLNWGYHPIGSLPLPDRYSEFALACAGFVQTSPGCNHFVIGNEPNWSVERPHGAPISPESYTDCFKLCRDAIRRVQPRAVVIPAAIAPWNIETGPWLDYFEAMLRAIGPGNLDGIALHTYSRGSDPASVRSEAKMDAPYSHLHNGFRAYRDFLARVPAAMRHLPVFVTETNQIEPWLDQNTGWVQAAYQEIHGWNQQPGTQRIQAICLYRWADYDRWAICNKPGVQEDFRAALAHQYPSPEPGTQPATGGDKTVYVPWIPGGPKKPAEPPLVPPTVQWDPRLTARGVTLVEAPQATWRLVEARYLDEQESAGKHHIFVEAGSHVPVVVEWDGGSVWLYTDQNGVTDFPMYAAGWGYCVRVSEGVSDEVRGMGLGTVEQPEWGHHVSYRLVFRRAAGNSREDVERRPEEGDAPPSLLHPIADPALRIISQPFGVNPERYVRFGLAGHNGVDFAVPEGTPVRAVDSGLVVEVLDDADGYGRYVKLVHAWGHSLYAHLSRQDVRQGEQVQRGQQVGLSGNTGNSTGPHLHFGLRLNPITRGYPYDGYTDPLPYLTQDEAPRPDGRGALPPARESYLGWFQRYGEQYRVPWQLVAGLAFHESRFNPRAVSPQGAQGLCQFMPDTWRDMQNQLGVDDPFDPEQSIRAAAYYLGVIRGYLTGYDKGEWQWVLAGYNAGMGIASQRAWEEMAAETRQYAREVLVAAELLGRWEMAYAV